jgi:hemoglobin
MSKTDIENRKDVELLVHTFYGKVRDHEVLGPIFNGIVADWPNHLEHLCDFWEMVLLQTGPGKAKFNPVKVHKEVDHKTAHSLSQLHFGNWLELWLETLRNNFEGKKADYAKEHARNMAGILFFRIYESRPK